MGHPFRTSGENRDPFCLRRSALRPFFNYRSALQPIISLHAPIFFAFLALALRAPTQFRSFALRAPVQFQKSLRAPGPPAPPPIDSQHDERQINLLLDLPENIGNLVFFTTTSFLNDPDIFS